jgi:hypothetical protein|uniref:Uncharacterized protein n=1 Tax=Zea mays TaxID=4577 RepID=B8A093_MAIZE|nr:unknown [Zea mays]
MEFLNPRDPVPRQQRIKQPSTNIIRVLATGTSGDSTRNSAIKPALNHPFKNRSKQESCTKTRKGEEISGRSKNRSATLTDSPAAGRGSPARARGTCPRCRSPSPRAPPAAASSCPCSSAPAASPRRRPSRR